MALTYASSGVLVVIIGIVFLIVLCAALALIHVFGLIMLPISLLFLLFEAHQVLPFPTYDDCNDFDGL